MNYENIINNRDMIQTFIDEEIEAMEKIFKRLDIDEKALSHSMLQSDKHEIHSLIKGINFKLKNLTEKEGRKLVEQVNDKIEEAVAKQMEECSKLKPDYYYYYYLSREEVELDNGEILNIPTFNFWAKWFDLVTGAKTFIGEIQNIKTEEIDWFTYDYIFYDIYEYLTGYFPSSEYMKLKEKYDRKDDLYKATIYKIEDLNEVIKTIEFWSTIKEAWNREIMTSVIKELNEKYEQKIMSALFISI